MKPTYQVDAYCQNPRCESQSFSVLRDRIHKIGADDRPYTISQVVCPTCRMWGEVVSIKEIEPCPS